MPVIKMSLEVAEKIRDEYYEPEHNLKSLSEKYGVSVAAISNIITFKSWVK